MKTAKEYLEAEKARLTKQARDITAAADAEGRGLDAEERVKIDGILADVSDVVAKIAEQDDNDRLIKAIDAVSGVASAEPTVAPAAARTIGEAFVQSDGFKALKAHGLNGTWTTGPVEIGMKLTDGTNTVVSIGDASGALPLQPMVAPLLGPVEQAPTVASLFPVGTTSTNLIVYLEETTTTPGVMSGPYSTSAAAARTAVLTSEGTSKPAAYINFTKRSVNLEKLAAFLPISEEMLEDEPAIAAYVNTRLRLFIVQAEEARILTRLNASIGTAGYAEIGGNNMLDSVMSGIVNVRLEGGLEPDGLLVHPMDYAKMAIAKASTGGEYFGGGPFSAFSANPWGLRTVPTAAVAAGSPIVGAFGSGAQLWRRGGLTVEATNTHADYFVRNLVAVRAEERLAVAIYRPQAFQKLFLTS
jgi:HK97 family phage major capsid protein